MMLRHLGETEAADRLYAALIRTLAERQIRTRDLGGTATTTEFTQAVIRELKG